MPSLYSVVFCTRVALVCKEEGSSPVFLQLLRGGIWACIRCPCALSLLGFGMGTMLVNFHMCGKSSFQQAREECESKRAYVF